MPIRTLPAWPAGRPLRAWQEDVFSHEGKFWRYKDISIWPRPYQRPHPPVWIPFTGSK